MPDSSPGPEDPSHRDEPQDESRGNQPLLEPFEELRLFKPDDTVARYTRAQAIADGVLVDVSEAARQAGYHIPVALTLAAWNECVAVPEGVEGQDESGRLWDVLYMCRVAIGRSQGGSELTFQLNVRSSNQPGVPPPVTLKAVCSPDDNGAPCITILLDQED
jgi:hypothetical protein